MATAPDRLTAAEAIELGIARKLVLHLDGVECRDVRAYCISEGWVETLDRDENGKIRHTDGEFVVKRVSGALKVGLVE